MLPINALVQLKGNQMQAIFALFWRAGGRARVRAGVRGGVQFEGVVRKNRSVPSLRQFTAQPISCGDLAYSFVFVFSSCCFPSQAFPFVVLENEKNAISPSSPL